MFIAGLEYYIDKSLTTFTDDVKTNHHYDPLKAETTVGQKLALRILLEIEKKRQFLEQEKERRNKTLLLQKR